MSSLKVIALSLLALSAASVSSLQAQVIDGYPTQPIKLVVPFPPGGASDIIARIVGQRLAEHMKATVVIENKAGANGAIAADTLLKAPADGQTLWLTSVGAVAINPALYPALPYDPVRDLAPVSLVVNNVEMLVVNPNNPINGPQEFIAAAKQKPTTMASSGTGSVPHLAMELLADATKSNLIHVPYKGAAPAITDVMAGHVDGFFGDIPGLMSGIRSGKLKPVALASTRRHPLFPDVKTFQEIGVTGVDSDNWYALFTHKNIPAADLERINQAVRRTLANEAVRSKLVASGAEPSASSSAELSTLLKNDMAKWSRVIRDKKVKAD
jgi:tripartite-type tricarboxylate transporter receptor subunit TctC